jgi:hypothetical protein
MARGVEKKFDRYVEGLSSVYVLFNYQQKMEQFYNEMAQVMRTRNFCLWLEDHGYLEEAPLDEALFEEVGYVDPADPYDFHDFLESMVEIGYRIMMDFYAPDVILGNIAVKLGDKWFAFGQCKNDIDEKDRYVTEIWPLKYVLPRIKQMEVKLRYVILLSK